MESMRKMSLLLLRNGLYNSFTRQLSNIQLQRTSQCCNIRHKSIYSIHTSSSNRIHKLSLVKTQPLFGLSPCSSYSLVKGYATTKTIPPADDTIVRDEHLTGPTANIEVRTTSTKKKTGIKPTGKDSYKLVAYGTSEHINLIDLEKELRSQQVYEVLTNLPKDLLDVLIVEAKYAIDGERREIFFFRKGAIVFWNVPDVERTSVLRAARKFQKFPADGEESESLVYKYTDTATRLITEPNTTVDIHLQKTEVNPEQILQKYAISNSLLATVKLGMYETQLEKRMDYYWAILLDLKQGKLRLTRHETLKQIGEQSMLRYYINMRSDLLDVPDFYWDREALEELYFKIQDMYNIDKRTEVMNQKLDSSMQLIEILRDHLTNAHSSFLEKLIIFLILLEVIFSLDHYNLGPEALVNSIKRALNLGPDDEEEDIEPSTSQGSV